MRQTQSGDPILSNPSLLIGGCSLQIHFVDGDPLISNQPRNAPLLINWGALLEGGTPLLINWGPC